MVKTGDKVTLESASYGVWGIVQSIIETPEGKYADVNWNKPHMSRRLHVMKLKVISA